MRRGARHLAIRVLGAAGMRRCHAVVAASRAWRDLDRDLVVVDGWPMSVDEVRRHRGLLIDVVSAEPGTRRLDPDDGFLRLLGFGLAAVNAGAVATGAAMLPGTATAPAGLVVVAALVAALLAVGVQTVVAVQWGRRLWTWRHRPYPDRETPSRDAAVWLASVTLLTTGGLIGAAHYLLAQAGSSNSALGSTLGLVLAASAVASPWLVVAATAYRPSPARRALAATNRVLARVAGDRTRLRHRARTRLGSAERLLGRVQGIAAQHEPDGSCRAATVRLADAVESARAAYRALAGEDPSGPLGRDDLDLAG